LIHFLVLESAASCTAACEVTVSLINLTNLFQEEKPSIIIDGQLVVFRQLKVIPWPTTAPDDNILNLSLFLWS
jgi:hypothetical protein